MSLSDALLLEPYRDPREIWIALRTDGQKGSGTMADPYDGIYADRPVPIASIAIAAGIATVATRAPHGRQDNEWVVITGAVENSSEQSAHNGSYPISNVSTYQFSYSPVAYDGLSIPTTEQPHGLVVGQAVRIASNIPPPLEQADFYQVATVPSPTSFTFDTGGTTPPGNYFGALWQVGRAVRDSNVIELLDL